MVTLSRPPGRFSIVPSARRAKGALALLPRTDLIGFADPEAPKDQEAFPSEEQIQAMKGLEV